MELDRKILKQLWDGKKVICPKCKEDYLIPLHKGKKTTMIFNVLNAKKYLGQ